MKTNLPKTSALAEATPSPLTNLLTVLGRHHAADGTISLVVVPIGAPLESAIKVPFTLLTVSRHAQLQENFLKAGAINLAATISPKEMSSLLLQAANQCRSTVLDREGIHAIEFDGTSYTAMVKGGRVFWLGKEPEGMDIVLIGSAAKAKKSEGAISAFNGEFSTLLKTNPRLLVCLCFALASYLFKAFAMRPICLALIASSSTGKTTLQAFTALVVTGNDKLMTMNATEIGLHDRLANSDLPMEVIEDAHGPAAAPPLLRAIMDVGNGGSRTRSRVGAAGAPTAAIECSLLVSAEEDLASTVRSAGMKLQSGMYARWFEIHAGTHGMADDIGRFENAAALMTKLKTRGPIYRGVVGDALLAAIGTNWSQIRLRWVKAPAKIRAAILKHAGLAEVDGVNGRLLDSLSFCAFIGGIAVDHRVLTVARSDIAKAFGVLFAEHVQRLNVKRTPVAQQVIESIRHFIQTNAGKFLPISQAADAVRPNGLAGYLKRTDDAGIYLFFPGTFREKFVDRFGTETYEHLRAANLIVTQAARGNMMSVRIPALGGGEGKRQDFVAVRSAILDAEGN